MTPEERYLEIYRDMYRETFIEGLRALRTPTRVLRKRQPKAPNDFEHLSASDMELLKDMGIKI